jgi:predicted RNase H-like HicB family nuclease
MNFEELTFLAQEDPEGGYSARSIKESIYTQGDTIEELKKNIKDALKCHFENDNEAPKYIKLHILMEEIFSYG